MLGQEVGDLGLNGLRQQCARPLRGTSLSRSSNVRG
jgi:hypothetical protein